MVITKCKIIKILYFTQFVDVIFTNYCAKKNGSEFLITIEQCCKDDQFFFLRFYKKLFYDISI